MSAAVAQYAFGRAENSTTVVTDAINTAASGRTFLVISSDTGDMSDPTDNYDNTYIPCGSGNSNAGNQLRAWICVNGTGGTGHQVTGTKSSAGYPVMMLLDIPGALTSGAHDSGAYNQTGDDFTSFDITTSGASLAQADNLVIAAFTHGATGTTTASVASPFTMVGQEMDTGHYWPLAVASGNVNSTDPVTASFTREGANQTGLLIVVIKSAAGGSTTTLTADAASITETANDANLAMARVLLSSPATVTDTTSDANLARSLRLTADAASVAETASDAGFRRALAIGGASAEVNIGMPGAGLVRGRLFAADVGAVTLSENAAGLFYNPAVIADSHAVALSFSDAGVLRTRIFAADTAAITEAVPDAGLYRNRAVIAEPDAIALTGSDAQLIRPHSPLAADVASVAITARDAGLLRNPAILADPAPVSLAIRDTGADAVILTAGTSSFALAASDATMTRTILFAADSAGITESVSDAALLRASVLSAEPGAVALAGQDAGFLRSLLFQADGVSFATAMSDAMPANGRVLGAGAATFDALVSDAGLRRTLILAAEVASIGQTTADAGFEKGRKMAADGATLSASWHANSLLTARTMPADKVGFSLGVNGVVDPPILTRIFQTANYGATIPDGAFARALRLVITPFALAFAEYGQDYTLHAEPAAYSFMPRNAGMNKGVFVAAVHAPVSLQMRNADLLRNRRLLADVNTIRLNAAVNTTFLTASRAAFSVGTPDAPISKYRGLIAEAVQFAEQAKDANLARAVRLIASTATFTLNTQEGGDTPIYDGTMFETDFGSQIDTLSIDVVSEMMVLTA